MYKNIPLLTLLIATSAQAYELQNLQGYYKSKSSIAYITNKINQNKVEFLNLDHAIKNLSVSNSPQQLSDITSLAAASSISPLLLTNFDYEGMVCVIEKDGAKVAFEIESSGTGCSFSIDNIHKVMAKKTDGSLVFFKRYGSGDKSQYYIEEIDASGNTMQSRYLFRFNGKLIGDWAIIKRSAGVYNIEHYSDYGDADTSLNKVGHKEYQWSEGFTFNGAIEVNAFSYTFGPTATVANVNKPYYWAIKDKVQVLDDTPIVELVSRYQKSTDNLNKVKDTYSTSSLDDLLSYNFNNANRLVGLSPDACMISQIKDGKSQIERFQGYVMGADCTNPPSDLSTYPKKVYGELENDGGKKIKPSELKASAIAVSTAVAKLSNNSVADLSEADFSAMKKRYDDAVAKYQSKLVSLEFWK
ncbi:hypothetical protein BIT28_06010 [Photobacterium proteolyticum]|uniref:Uncharacterized protein n=1 Tax=Photobacterium proteolyticum TaxID=1903952 RepID=A0A1Q9GEC6_9GAMM|nr:hypothetical protein [Photobacterium proteolyticum]OLQ72748.1 hypothetical protein BIT28_06010 [Photobacterium proteolyticum]